MNPLQAAVEYESHDAGPPAPAGAATEVPDTQPAQAARQEPSKLVGPTPAQSIIDGDTSVLNAAPAFPAAEQAWQQGNDVVGSSASTAPPQPQPGQPAAAAQSSAGAELNLTKSGVLLGAAGEAAVQAADADETAPAQAAADNAFDDLFGGLVFAPQGPVPAAPQAGAAAPSSATAGSEAGAAAEGLADLLGLGSAPQELDVQAEAAHAADDLLDAGDSLAGPSAGPAAAAAAAEDPSAALAAALEEPEPEQPLKHLEGGLPCADRQQSSGLSDRGDSDGDDAAAASTEPSGGWIADAASEGAAAAGGIMTASCEAALDPALPPTAAEAEQPGLASAFGGSGGLSDVSTETDGGSEAASAGLVDAPGGHFDPHAGQAAVPAAAAPAAQQQGGMAAGGLPGTDQQLGVPAARDGAGEAQLDQEPTPSELLLQAAERLEGRLAVGAAHGGEAGGDAGAAEEAAYRDDLLLASLISQVGPLWWCCLGGNSRAAVERQRPKPRHCLVRSARPNMLPLPARSDPLTLC